MLCNFRHVSYNSCTQHRTQDTEQRLSLICTAARRCREDLSFSATLPRRDIALYVRHVLCDVPLQDYSLVDDLVDIVGDSLSNAVIACDFVHCGPAQEPHYSIRALVNYQPNNESLPSRILNHTLANLDNDIYLQLEQDSTFDSTTTKHMDWVQLCKIHSLIARACLRTMDRLLRFNICSIPSSYTLNNDARFPGSRQPAQDKGQISSALTYACTHWMYHVWFALLGHCEMVMELATVFLKSHALHWLEVLSLTAKDARHLLRPLSGFKVSVKCFLFLF